MNKILIGVVIAIIVICGGAYFLTKHQFSPAPVQNAPTQSQQQSPTVTTQTTGQNAVTIQNFAFSPATLTVKVGEKVTWTNQDTIGHSATADDGSFDTGVLSQGQSGSVTFSKAGTYTYHCSVHPNMTAKVVVE